MQIWKTAPTLKGLNESGRNNIHETLGITFTQIGDDFLEASMPVDHRTLNPVGLLHGGASVVLAESLGSIAAMLVAGIDTTIAVGIEVNASHLTGVTSGFVKARVTPVRLGKTVHVWSIQVFDGTSTTPKQVCQARLTVMVRPKSA